MAKSKKRAPARKSSAKRRNASVKAARKNTARRATKKKAKSKVHRTKRVAKPTPKELPPAQEVVVEKSIQATVVAAIGEPTPAVVVVTETIQVAAPTEAERERDIRPVEGIDSPEQKVA